ncbi:GTP cyclohydrolase I [Desulfocurvibacter africanus PCS]|uniref:GTP cyclohydrolase FolE2 n=2 Tax=Desulfocurvibacter africanus TaxID=873 RepID=M5Q3F9_DESAF|nr:GTP cyclohydrolase I [Desulfocurvibacter africanus PCS]
MAGQTPPTMQDVQSAPAEVALSIDRVGVKHLMLPLVVRDRAQGVQHTVARVDLGVDLPAAFKGTHMSRFVEALENWKEELDYHSFKALLTDIRQRLSARKAYVVFRFPYFLKQASPKSGSPGWMSYECTLTGEMAGETMIFTLAVDVPVMTVCPCSLAISDQGAHSQRAMVRVMARFTGFLWLEDLIEIAEASASSPVYTLLKREDEKHVTESAFAKPTFVEDVVRGAAQRLDRHPQVNWYRVEVESFESIHAHSAFASIEKTK